MTELDQWLTRATRGLSKDSAAQVRTEIREHYDQAREAAMAGGMPEADAGRLALAALGDARTANRRYRNVLLTSVEARILGSSACEARAICSRPWLKRLLLATPAALLLAAAALFAVGSISAAWILLCAASMTGLIGAAPFLLPVNTPLRGTIFRAVKWTAILAVFGAAFGSSGLWLLLSSLWPIAWIEWTRSSIRRKLPAGQWPRHLYL